MCSEGQLCVIEITPSHLGEGTGHFSTRSLQHPVTLESFQSKRVRVSDTCFSPPLDSSARCCCLGNTFWDHLPDPCELIYLLEPSALLF